MAQGQLSILAPDWSQPQWEAIEKNLSTETTGGLAYRTFLVVERFLASHEVSAKDLRRLWLTCLASYEIAGSNVRPQIDRRLVERFGGLDESVPRADEDAVWKQRAERWREHVLAMDDEELFAKPDPDTPMLRLYEVDFRILEDLGKATIGGHPAQSPGLVSIVDPFPIGTPSRATDGGTD